SFFSQCSANPAPLTSFPTRRSSDLRTAPATKPRQEEIGHGSPASGLPAEDPLCPDDQEDHPCHGADRGQPHPEGAPARVGVRARSEEHTSELQSRENLVCRLLLEKK